MHWEINALQQHVTQLPPKSPGTVSTAHVKLDYQIAEIVRIPHRHTKKLRKIVIKWIFRGYAGLNKLRLPRKNCPDCDTYMSGFSTLKLSGSAQTSAPKVKILSGPWHIPHSGFSGVLLAAVNAYLIEMTWTILRLFYVQNLGYSWMSYRTSSVLSGTLKYQLWPSPARLVVSPSHINQ